MYRFLLAALVGLAPGVARAAADTASLTIKVENVSTKGGDLRLALYDAVSYERRDSEPVKGAVVPAKPGETIVVLDNLRPGTYAIKMMQDENRNGMFDSNFIGLPIERYGFSNDARPTFREPPFSAAKFVLKPGTNTTMIHLR